MTRVKKTCTKCSVLHNISEFRLKKRWYENVCKPCQSKLANERNKNWRKLNPGKVKIYKRREALKQYLITLDQYNELNKAQQGLCRICGAEDKTRSLAVDHDHKTNKVRGLLCNCCNRGLGYFYDNPNLLNNAVSYLKGEI